MIFIGACTKKVESVSEKELQLQSKLYKTVIDYFDKEIQKTKDNETLLYLKSLKEKIDKKSLAIVDYHNTKAIVLSIGKNSILESEDNNLEKIETETFNNVFNRLVFYLNQDTIINAETLECRTNMSEEVLENDLSGIVNFNPSNYKGQVRHRKLNQKFLYTVMYETDRKGYLVVKKGGQNNESHPSGIAVNSDCIDWYIVTTYTYPDGTQTVTEEYIGSTCGDPDGCTPDPYLQQLPSGACNGGGGNSGSNGGPNDDDIPRKKLCGNYTWKTTGAPQGAANTVIKNLWATFGQNNNPAIRITVSFSDACITIPNHCSTNQATLSSMFNDAFNAAVTTVEAGLSSGTIPPGDLFIKSALDAAIKAALIVECAGSHFVNQGCTPDIPWQLPTFCG